MVDDNMDSPRILVVEDEHNLASDIRKSLLRLGYTYTEIVNTGEEAITKVAEVDPNLVLIDICLTGTVGAKEAAEIIENKFHVPVLYLADYIETLKAGHTSIHEPFRYLHKPFADRDLHIAVEMALYKNQVEQRLTHKIDRLANVIHGIGSGVITTDELGRIEMMNPIAESLTGWREAEVLKRNFADIIKLVDTSTGELMSDLLAQVMQEGQIIKLPDNCTLITRNGHEVPIGDSVAPIRDRHQNICGVVFIFQDISQRKQTEALLMRNAFYDALTALPNRVLFLDRLRQAFERAKRRHNYKFAVLFIDLDGFKEINDHYGHGMGDDLLIAIARRLEACLRSGDTVARFGGDEFAAVLEEIKDETDATNIAHRIQDALRVPLQLNGQQLVVTASIGIAIHSDAHEEPANLLRDADIAMYRAKKLQGKASYAVFA